MRINSRTDYLLDESANDWALQVMIVAQQDFTDCIDLLKHSGHRWRQCLAAECGHHKTLDLLLRKMEIKQMEDELRPKLSELKTRNPIHLAISHERIKCLEVLLKHGFDIESVD